MKIVVGLGWEVNKDIFEEDIDIDLAAFQLNKDGRVESEEDFIFYNNPVNSNESVRFSGDNKIGSVDSTSDNEIIEIDSNNIPEYIDRISITASIYEAEERKQNFSMVLNAYAKVIDSTNDTELIRYDLSEDFPFDKSIIIGELVRNKEDHFTFKPMGTSFDGELGNICEKYGLFVEE